MGLNELIEKARENGCDVSIEIKRSVKNEESMEIVTGNNENRRKRAMDRLREDYSAVELAEMDEDEIEDILEDYIDEDDDNE